MKAINIIKKVFNNMFNNNTTIYVVLQSHSEYCGFSVFSGIFRSKEEAIENWKKHFTSHRYPLVDIIKVDEGKSTYIIPIRKSNESEIDRIKEELKYDASSTAYYFGGFLIEEMTI